MDNDEVSRLIFEFYNTTNETVRKQHSMTLNAVQDQPDWCRRSILLVQSNFPPVVQFFAAKSLLNLLNKKFDTIVEDTELTNEIRQFYLQRLTEGTQSLPHSLLNILSSGLAVFLMKCLPDIWPNPFFDLANLWASQQELLLRVFAEVGAEFPRISITLKQRNILRAELLKVSQDIAQIVNVVLSDPESPPSLKNAAIECVELWLKLPGAKISDFLNVFTSVFDNVSNDIVALSRILSTLKANEELPHLPQLIQQITQFIAASVVPLILTEVNNVLLNEDSDFAEYLSDIIPLICAVTEFAYAFTRQIVARASESLGSSDQGDVNVYFTLCAFFTQLSTIKRLYPVKECISDLPEPFWCALREELTQLDESKPYASNKALLCRESVKYFLEILQSAVDKIAYFPEVETTCDKSQLERFESYRLSRGDVSTNAFQIAQSETLNLLVSMLDNYLDEHDIYRCEATLYYLYEAVDFLKEDHISLILPPLYKTGLSKQWLSIRSTELTRYGKTLILFMQRIEHLILTSSYAHEILPKVIEIILDFLYVPDVDGVAIDALIAYVKNRDSVLQVVVDLLIAKCYEYFNCETKNKELRLNAIRCMGITLSMKENSFILNSLDQFLAPRILSLKNLISSDCQQSIVEQESRILFELGVLAQLVATLEVNNNQGNLLEENDEENAVSAEAPSSPVRLIIDQCISFFNIVLNNTPIPSRELVSKVCEVLRAGLLSLHTLATPFIDTYLNYLNVFLFHYSDPACDLAKTLFLTYRNDTNMAATLFRYLAQWYSQYSEELHQQEQQKQIVFSEKDEKFLELASHILKKNWLIIESLAKSDDELAGYVECFLQNVCFSATKVIEQSRDISLMQEGYRVIGLILKNCISSESAVFDKIVATVGQAVVSTAFMGIQSELCSTHLPLIADILFYFTKAHPDLARQYVAALPGGDSQISCAMFSQNLSIRNFRLRVSQMHQASLKHVT